MRRKLIRTRRLVLRPLARSDYATWLDAHTDHGSKRSRFEPPPRRPHECTRAAFEAIRARNSERARQDAIYVLGVFHARSRVLVGMVDVAVLRRAELQLGNLGYWVFAPHRRRGYAREAVLAVMHAAFEDWKLNRLEAVIDLPNRPSQRLVRALGLERECIRRKYFFENGRFHDQVVWTAQREDFGHAPLVPRL